MAEITKKISADDRLKYIGLMTLASEHKLKANEYEEAIHRMLGTEAGGWISDTVWGSGVCPPSIHDMDDALLKEGVGVED